MRVWIHIFHRDLRIHDNSALRLWEHYHGGKSDTSVLPIFIFTPAQVDATKNKFFSSNSVQFMIDSLADLDEQLKGEGTHLHCFYGDTIKVLEKLVPHIPLAGIIENYDYTPFAKERTAAMAAFCAKHEIEYIVAHDIYLNIPGTILNKAGKPFQKFTPFYEASLAMPVAKPANASVRWYRIGKLSSYGEKALMPTLANAILPMRNPKIHLQGGRANGLKILNTLKQTIRNYETDKDTPSKPTSNLSAHNHFGTVSIREVYWAAGSAATEFIRQLYWRDFYGHICDAFETLYGESPYDFMKNPSKGWRTSHKDFEKWATGTTGHELVDAAMKQLVETGYIHNRARLVAASYLAKELRIHWRWGEAFFAQHLVDYDFAQNFGNWCWVASVLPFSSAPFRRLDPERQLELTDPERKYVDKWLDADEDGK
jgi:deoxyribodipyrimidine photo-lyase